MNGATYRIFGDIYHLGYKAGNWLKIGIPGFVIREGVYRQGFEDKKIELAELKLKQLLDNIK